MNSISYFERVVKAYSCRVTWHITLGLRISKLTIATLADNFDVGIYECIFSL